MITWILVLLLLSVAFGVLLSRIKKGWLQYLLLITIPPVIYEVLLFKNFRDTYFGLDLGYVRAGGIAGLFMVLGTIAVAFAVITIFDLFIEKRRHTGFRDELQKLREADNP